MSMRTMLLGVASLLLLACAGGGDCKPESLGLGLAEPGLVGQWDYTLDGDSARHLLLEADGTMADQPTGGGSYPGFWGLDADGKLSVQYSLTRECPPTGTLMTATGVTSASSSIDGTIVSSPMPGLTGKSWSIDRPD
jgi:hypothetical protein